MDSWYARRMHVCVLHVQEVGASDFGDIVWLSVESPVHAKGNKRDAPLDAAAAPMTVVKTLPYGYRPEWGEVDVLLLPLALPS